MVVDSHTKRRDLTVINIVDLNHIRVSVPRHRRPEIAKQGAVSSNCVRSNGCFWIADVCDMLPALSDCPGGFMNRSLGIWPFSHKFGQLIRDETFGFVGVSIGACDG